MYIISGRQEIDKVLSRNPYSLKILESCNLKIATKFLLILLESSIHRHGYNRFRYTSAAFQEKMKKHDLNFFLQEDRAIIQGRNVPLRTTSAGHYILPLQECLVAEEVFALNLKEASDSEKKAVEKLHKQFGHRQKKCAMTNS